MRVLSAVPWQRAFGGALKESVASRAPVRQQTPERDLAAQPSWKHVALLGEPAAPWLPGERRFDL